MASATERANQEEDLRKAWVQKVQELIREAGLPLSKFAANSADPAGIWDACAGSRRAITIRQHCRKWQKVRD